MAVRVQKLQEWENVHGTRKRGHVISYGKLAAQFGLAKKELQEVSVAGKLCQKPHKEKAAWDKKATQDQWQFVIKQAGEETTMSTSETC